MSNTNVDLYRELCLRDPSIPIFSRDWWLDATCGANPWDVAIVQKNSQIIGAMPYLIKRRFGITVLGQPMLSQTAGPWVSKQEGKYSKLLGTEKNIMQALIDQLPSFDHFSQNWHYDRTNWLPFYWRGFRQTTRYTYVLPDLSDEKKLWGNLQENIRTDIRKATGRFGVRIRDDIDLVEFLRIVSLTFLRQGKKMPYDASALRRLDHACNLRSCRKVFIAEDKAGLHHACIYMVWDERSAYYIIGGGDPGLRNSGATSLCLWEAIKHAATVTERFDFEGSMIEPVERFFRGFGAIQTPYFHVFKTPSHILRARSLFSS